MGTCLPTNIEYTQVPITINTGTSVNPKDDSIQHSPVFRSKLNRPILQKLIRKHPNSCTTLGKLNKTKRII